MRRTSTWFQKAKDEEKPKKLKQLPPPPEEHAYELKMERYLKRLVGKEEKKKATKGPS